MPLQIQHREREGIEILDLDGNLVFGEEDILFRDEVQKLLDRGQHKVVLNCKEIDRLDSVGVGTLICVQETLQPLGGNLALANVKLKHLELLVILKLEAFFAIFETENEAVNSFFPERHVERVDVLRLVRTLMKPAQKEIGENQK